jgi:myo-inositol-1(or 4)-monophosphatase
MNRDPLPRIREALLATAENLLNNQMQHLVVDHHASGPVTNLDRTVNKLLQEMLPRKDEGWLSEETRDDCHRLSCHRVWIVDPIDGTRELIERIPEWCVSVCMVEDGDPIAGGVLNPSTGELFLGSRESGLQIFMLPAKEPPPAYQADRCVLVSRKEHSEGKWERFADGSLQLRPVGSIAYRLARVAAGYASATCTFEPRSEWDVAAGVALIEASGGVVSTATGERIRFNAEVPRLPSFFAFAKNCCPSIPELLRAAA